MDPLSAVGLAGNIVQFVQFSCSLVSTTTDIYRSESGQLQSNVELDIIAKDISQLCVSIRQGVTGQKNVQLSQLAAACQPVADDLVALISKIKRKDGRGGRWESFRQALRSVLESEDIKKLSDRLEALRSQMNTRMLSVVEYDSCPHVRHLAVTCSQSTSQLNSLQGTTV